MLKLERKPKSRDVSIHINESRKLLTPTFKRALWIALGIHLAGLILFQITPFKINHLETIFPPVQVKIDFLPLIDSGVLAELENEKTARSPVPPPPLNTPETPRPPRAAIQRNTAHPRVKQIAAFPFEHMEDSRFYDSFIPFSPPPPARNTNREIAIIIVGELSQRAYALNLNLNDDGPIPKERILASYRVKVDSRTGKVFWHQAVWQPDGKKTAKLAEKVIAALQFERDPDGFIAEGEIEMELPAREKEI